MEAHFPVPLFGTAADAVLPKIGYVYDPTVTVIAA